MLDNRPAGYVPRSEPMISSHLNALGIRKGLPVSGNFELTARCNFDCRMCYVHQNGDLRRRELSADTWLGLASDARDLGMMFLLLTGGEPFIREDFPYIYEELVRMGLVVSVNTNASLYSEELRELFLKYPPSRLNVTLYGASEETYRALCRSASYEKVVSNLRSMKADGLQVRLNVSLTPWNVADMEGIHQIAADIGLNAKGSAYMYPPVRLTESYGENAARFSPEEAGRVFAAWNRLNEGDERFLAKAEAMGRWDNCEEILADSPENGVRCRAGRSSFWLTWEGKMLPCGTMDIETSDALSLGFAKAWEEVRARTAAIRLPAECASCSHRQNCSLCASICRCESGGFDKRPEYLCKMEKSRYEETQKLAQLIKEENHAD